MAPKRKAPEKTARKVSAGLAVIRRRPVGLELLLVHPGGPFWRNKDEHAWSIPKGEVDTVDTGDLDTAILEATARREFTEETGHDVPEGPLIPLEPFRVGSGKRLAAFAVLGDLDAEEIESNTFEMEWPPRSGRTMSFPEVDRAEWVAINNARTKLHKGQGRILDLLDPVVAEAGW